MKHLDLKIPLGLLAFCLLSAGSASATTIAWTNTSGGNWSVPANWNPNQTPGAADTAVITNNGTYAVTLDVSASVANLTLGGFSGQQTLATASNPLTLNGASVVNANGVLALTGGSLSGGGHLTVNGQFTWTGGFIAPGSTLTVATSGLLVVAGGGSHEVDGVLTNAGTIRLVSGDLTLAGVNCGGQGQLINLSGALLDIQSDSSIIRCSSSSELLVNIGTVRKSGGTGSSSINVPFNNSGLLEVQSGTVNLSGGGNGSGVFETEAGATANFSSHYTLNTGVQFIGAGTNLLTGGTITLNGLITTSNLTLAGSAFLAGSNGIIAGVLTWTGGVIAYGSTLTVATTGVLVLAGGGSHEVSGVLTNAGTIRLVSGDLTLVGVNCGGQGQLINLSGALLDIASDSSIVRCSNSSELLVNLGTVRKSGGTGSSSISASFNNSGLLDVQSGTVSLSGGGNGSGSGVFETQAGATANFSGGYTLNTGVQFTGAGTNLLTGGTFTLNGLITTSNLTVAGSASLAGSNGIIAGAVSLTGGSTGPGSTLTIAGVVTWTGGLIGPGSTLTVTTNGLLVVAGGGSHEASGVLTNAGTIRLVSGDLTLVGVNCGGQGQLINLSGALLDIQSDSSIIRCSSSSELLVNLGTVRKSGGTGSSSINVPFNNSGLLEVQSGTVSVSGGGNGSGVFETEAGATANFSSHYTLNTGVQFIGAGTNLLTGGTITLNGLITTSNLTLAGSAFLAGSNGIIAGVLTWTGGVIAYGSTLTVATTGVLVLAGGGSHEVSGVLTNAGTIRLVSGDLTLVGVNCGGQGQLINLSGALLDIASDSSIVRCSNSSELLVNLGTVRKSGGTGSSSISASFNNSGLLDVQSGTVSLSGGGNGSGSGVFETQAGATANFSGGYTLNTGVQFTGAGTNLLTGGAFTLNGLITTSNLTVAGSASLAGSNGIIAGAVSLTGGSTGPGSTLTIAGVVTWTGGLIGPGSTLTVATNGQLVVAVGGSHEASGVLTNAGTIRLVSGDLTLVGVNCGGQGQLINLSGALLDIASDSSIVRCSSSSELLVNLGTVRKSGGTGSSSISAPFNNSGLLDVQSGTVIVDGSYTLTGGSVNFGINGLANFGRINLPGSAALTGSLSANLNNGFVPINGNSFAVLTYGSETGSFTNFSLPSGIAWQTNYGATVFTLSVLNVAPALPLQTNRTINELTTLSVTNTATDSDLPANTLTYSLLVAPGTATISANGVITWTATENDGPGTNTFTTRVVDNGSPTLSATNTFQVTVHEVNLAPELTLPANSSFNEQAFFTNNATATDFDLPANSLTFALVSGPSGLNVSPSGAITWTPDESQGPSSYTVFVSVTDTNPLAVNANSISVTNSFTLTVNESNRPPALPIQTNLTINELTTLSVTNTATDSDLPANTLTYSLLVAPGTATISANGVITWTTTESDGPGTNTFATRVVDNGSPPLSATNTFQVTVHEVNVAPGLPLQTNLTINELTTLSVTNTATDSDLPADTLTYSLLVAPGTATISANGVITWTTTESDGPGTNTFTTRVVDNGSPTLSATNTFQVTVHEVNQAPELTLPANSAFNEQTVFTNNATATDFDLPANSLTFALVSGPSGLDVSPAGAITWTPDESQGSSSYTVFVSVTDTNPLAVNANSISVTNSFTLTVNESNRPPVIGPLTDRAVNPGQTISFTATATDADLPANTLSFTLVSPPSGATIVSGSGLFTWTPLASQAGTTNVLQVRVTDNGSPNLSGTNSFTVIVNPLAPIILTPVGRGNGQFIFQVSGPTGLDYIIMASSNLTQWSDIFTNPSPATPFLFTNSSAAAKRFYRARISTPGGAYAFVATGSLVDGGRAIHTAVRLADGRVLVVGGSNADGSATKASAETYDPATGYWSLSGAMTNARNHHTANLLPDGRVLVAGGADAGQIFAPTEIWNPTTGQFTAGLPMSVARAFHSSVRLSDGKILVVGGTAQSDGALAQASAEIYDPATGTWAGAGSMATARNGFVAVQLADGRVLIAGGACGRECGYNSLADCEIYNPVTGTFTPAASMSKPRAFFAGALLADGRVLVAAGSAQVGLSYHDTEIYDPITDVWSPAGSITAGGSGLTLTRLPNGRVLVAGGINDNISAPEADADLFDPITSTFSPLPSMHVARLDHTATLLGDGSVLIVGGQFSFSGPPYATSSAERFVQP